MRTRAKIAIFILACIPPISAIFILSWMLPGAGESAVFKGYEHVLPEVSYGEIISTPVWRSPWSDLQLQQAKKLIETPEDQLDPSGMGMDYFYETILPTFSDTASINDVYSRTSKELNIYLYTICQLYAGDMYLDDIRVSPLLPLAEANLEGGRVNTKMTFSGLAPSGVFGFESAKDLQDLDVTWCLMTKDVWKQMSSEYYTRDRGALQCNPDYGYDHESYGLSEASKLADYIARNGLPDYGTNKDQRGNTFTVQDWIDYSRTKHGDRFNPESLVKMFADEKKLTELPGIKAHFSDIQNEYHIYGIMAYNHWCGAGYMTMDEDMAYSGFHTIGRSKEYLRDISSPKAIEVIYSQCLQEIQSARAQGRMPVRCCDNNAARELFDILHEEGICKSWDYYFRHKYTGRWDQGVTACGYPLGLIYGVMQMNLLYSGY